MFVTFLEGLRNAGIPASPKEHLVLLEALDRDVIATTTEEFYYLARAIYVKDESLLDRFDQAFAHIFRGLESAGPETASVPEEWLKAMAEKYLTDEQRKKLCEMMYHAFIDMRLLGWAGKAEQVADLADAFHNLPAGMWRNDFSLQFFRDSFLKVYQEKYRSEKITDYISIANQIIAMKD